ncbi:MAG: porphobilinogen deaminase [Acidimicrobiia bacterium]|nr:MAG: porphobilinogen deaminase [Acidimicrobiia bacterium]
MTLRIATRGSPLARRQAERVGSLLGGDVVFVTVETAGDADQRSPLHAIGGQGVFAKEVQQAVLDGRADLAVHSAKDLPSATPEGLVLAAVPERADPRDALVGAALHDLPAGAVVGTDSVRRRAQLAHERPDLVFGPLRGNIGTRLRRREEQGYDAVVVAHAALVRLGLADRAADVLDPAVVLPQVGQGALAVECRADDARTRRRLAGADDPDVHRAVGAERAFLAELGGGCDVPCGALARVGHDGTVELDALVASLDGHVVLRTRVAGHDPVEVGRAAAHDLLERRGGRAVLGLGEHAR